MSNYSHSSDSSFSPSHSSSFSLPPNAFPFPNTTDEVESLTSYEIELNSQRKETKKLISILKESNDKLLEIQFNEGLESPYVYQDMFKSINSNSYYNNHFKEDSHFSEIGNELYNLIICLASRLSEFATRLSILIKMFLFLIGLIELLIRRTYNLENSTRKQGKEIREFSERIERIELKLTGQLVNNDNQTQVVDQVNWETLNKDLDELEQSRLNQFPPTPGSSKSKKSNCSKLGPIKEISLPKDRKFETGSRRSTRNSKPINYAESTSESDEIVVSGNPDDLNQVGDGTLE